MHPRPHPRTTLVFCVLLTLSVDPGCAQAPVRPVAGPIHGSCTGVVFCVDGSACLRDMSPEMGKAVSAARLPLRVESFRWSHGPGRVFADLRSRSRHHDKGKELAGAILARRQACPNGKVYLVCHSSGAAIGLAACKSLAPGSIDRIILLAPALSPKYDLRCPLRCTCEGIDVFASRRDVIGRTLAVVGNSDGSHCASAACCGFTPDDVDPGDAGIYAKLRQHPWESGMGAAGHGGGHFGCTRASFFSAYVVPLLGSCAAR